MPDNYATAKLPIFALHPELYSNTPSPLPLVNLLVPSFARYFLYPHSPDVLEVVISTLPLSLSPPPLVHLVAAFLPPPPAPKIPLNPHETGIDDLPCLTPPA